MWFPFFWEREPLGLPIFHLGAKFGAKILIDAEIMAENQYPRWRPSAILDYRKPDFWALGPLWLPILHLNTKFCAKMLIDAEIMAENRNPRWRPSAILDFRNTATPWASDFLSLYQIWCENVDRRRNMGQNRNPRYRPSAILDFRKSDFWELEPLWLPIFHFCA